MTLAAPAHLATLCRYPLKGFSAETLGQADVTPAEALPLDRAFALEFRDSGFDEENPAHVRKSYFLQLALFPELATVATTFDPATRTLTLSRDGKTLAKASVDTADGRDAIEKAAGAALAKPLPRQPRLIEGRTVTLTDRSKPFLSLINLASVADLGLTMDHELDPIRFRGNLYIEGWEPWVEAAMVGRTLRIGEAATFEVIKPVERCAATEVNLKTGTHDANVLQTLSERHANRDCGIFLAVTTAGTIRPGDPVIFAD